MNKQPTQSFTEHSAYTRLLTYPHFAAAAAQGHQPFAMLVDGEIVLGVVYNPYHGAYVQIFGRGATPDAAFADLEARTINPDYIREAVEQDRKWAEQDRKQYVKQYVKRTQVEG